ncbi:MULTISPECIES: Maf-like protein [Burkholderia]|jgi:septum formation protein|uniref:7-methyl-GTP pyrophosphatase n=2 Tax=Burkholderia gladioli TaxID=28095 RepID=A0AB38TU24_BURGA|nr:MULTISPECIES: Maf-like protein [Burkholderia]AJW99946.1 septum formation protein Maf [Burkholderia gladioli]ASD78462.1 septum formation protein Maf [Burkholderia gladioli pv. gladioli]AWY56296.1 septum formation protein Maf [Burkholderia gladioli pv. gladioli]MBA1361994.1 septum formation protein Maf [Burkholderia gladioli]MBJ9677662.1 septum formation protein Maf [Burkholderia gladioli]
MTTFSRPPRLILASSSRYRRELLERLRLAFEVVTPDLDETPLAGESPADTALRLAAAKARAVAARVEAPEGVVVIGSDQVATFDGRQVGKPGTHQRALEQLQAMRGREVEFHSALCVYDSRSDLAQVEDVVTRVRFRCLSDADLDAYLRAETPYDVAGSAKSEGLGIALLEAIDSNDPTALVGLPLIALTRMLAEAGISPFATEARA